MLVSVEMEIEVVCSFNESIHFFAKYNTRGLLIWRQLGAECFMSSVTSVD